MATSADERAYYVSILGMASDDTSISLAQLQALASIPLEYRQLSVLFDDSGKLKTGLNNISDAQTKGSLASVLNVVTQYGADPTGIASSSTAIQAAIDALPDKGGIVFFPVGNYKLTAGLTVGNGIAGTASTKHSVQLVGEANPGPGAAFITGASAGVSFTWGGGAGASMITFNGPIQGCGIKNILFDGGVTNPPNVALWLIAAQFGVFENVYIKNCSTSIFGYTRATFSGVNTNTMHNQWRNIGIWIPDLVGTTAGIQWLSLDGTSNTCYEYMENVHILFGPPSGGRTQWGINLGGADSCAVRGLHFINTTAGAGTKIALRFAYDQATGHADWPSDCFLEHVDFGTSIATQAAVNSGTPNGSAKSNRVVGIGATNGRPADPTLANLAWGYSNASP